MSTKKSLFTAFILICIIGSLFIGVPSVNASIEERLDNIEKLLAEMEEIMTDLEDNLTSSIDDLEVSVDDFESNFTSSIDDLEATMDDLLRLTNYTLGLSFIILLLVLFSPHRKIKN